MQEISDLILKAKALKQRKEYSQAITLLNRAHALVRLVADSMIQRKKVVQPIPLLLNRHVFELGLARRLLMHVTLHRIPVVERMADNQL